MCCSIFSIRPLLPHRLEKIYRFKLRAVCTVCSPEPQIPLQNITPNKKFPSALGEPESIIPAYPERILMRILPANTELRNQHHGQLFPLEVPTGKSYQSKSYENTRLFSNNSDRPHSRLLPSSL